MRSSRRAFLGMALAFVAGVRPILEAPPVVQATRRWTIDEILIAEAHNISHDIHKKVLGESPWIALSQHLPQYEYES